MPNPIAKSASWATGGSKGISGFVFVRAVGDRGRGQDVICLDNLLTSRKRVMGIGTLSMETATEPDAFFDRQLNQTCTTGGKDNTVVWNSGMLSPATTSLNQWFRLAPFSFSWWIDGVHFDDPSR